MVETVSSRFLSKLKNLLGQRRSQVEKLGDFDLSGRPFTEAMLYRAATETDAAAKDLKAMGTSLQPTKESSDLDEAIVNAACSVAFDITTAAMREIGRGMFMPLEALPDDAQRIISFSFFVVMALVAPLKKEGYEMKFVEVCMQTSNLFVLVHRPDEKFELYKQSADAFRYIVKNATPNVDEWRESLEKLVYYYVIQWTTEDANLKSRKFPPFFGSLLNSLLKA